MPNDAQDWVKIPPRADRSPEQIREERDRYRAIADAALLEEWKNVKLEDWSSSEGGNAEIQAIIAELEATLASS